MDQDHAFVFTTIADEAIATGDKVRISSENGHGLVVPDDGERFAGWAMNDAEAGKAVAIAVKESPPERVLSGHDCPQCRSTGTEWILEPTEIHCFACGFYGHPNAIFLALSPSEAVHLRNVLHFYVRHTAPPVQMLRFAEGLFGELRSKVGPMPYENKTN